MAGNEGSVETIDDGVDEAGASALLRVVGPDEDAPVVVANALGAAWSTYQLHPDPRNRIGFERAVDALAIAPALECLGVTADHFTLRGTSVQATHAGAGRLADRLFLTGIAAVEFVDTPTGDDLYHLFETVRRTLPELDEAGGPANLLHTLGATTIRLVETRVLVEDAEPDATDDTPGVRTVANPAGFAGDPAGFAAALIDAAGDDPARFADLVIRSYERVHLGFDPLAADEREAVVHTFVDMFFHLPSHLQAPTIFEVLSRYEEEPFRTFLDQFAGHEINALAPLLDSTAHPLLQEYARIATLEASGPVEVAALLDSLHDGSAIDDVVHRRITEVVGGRAGATGTSSSFRRLAASLPDPARYRAAGIDVFQGLMRGEGADHDRRRLFRIWVGKVVSAIRAGSAEAAHDWMDAVFADDTMTDDDDHTAQVVLARGLTLAAVTDLAEMLHTDPESAPALDLLRRLAPHAGTHLVSLLGDEPVHSRRRQLIEMAVEAARIEPRPFVTGLADPRWYLLRNLAIILGRSEHGDVVDHLCDLRSHADERVRREAIRGIYGLVRDADIQPFVDALLDPEAGVRKVAATILKNARSDDLPLMLERALDSPASTEAKLDVVGLLAGLGSEASRQALARVRAGRAPRAVRHAADLALEGAA